MESSFQPAPWKDLEVPGEPGVYFCARHKNVKTRLRCGSCEKPICPKCTKYGPTGARCADCLSMRSSHIYKLSLAGALGAFGVAFGAGVVGAIILSVVGLYSFWALLYAPAIGPFLGKSIIRASGGKSGTKVALTASAGFILGAVVTTLAPVVPLLLAGSHRADAPDAPVGALVAMSVLFHPFLWLMVVIAVVSLWLYLK